jgi:CheY-specific phosphatase CheX
MRFAESELRQITEETWQILLGENLQRYPRLVSLAQVERPVAACAQIVGDWDLGVIAYCPQALAQHAACLMFRIVRDKVTSLDVQDVMCELVNIIAGNVKGMLSGTNFLSLPSFTEGGEFELRFTRHVLLSEACFAFESQPLLVQVLGEDRLAPDLTED